MEELSIYLIVFLVVTHIVTEGSLVQGHNEADG